MAIIQATAVPPHVWGAGLVDGGFATNVALLPAVHGPDVQEVLVLGLCNGCGRNRESSQVKGSLCLPRLFHPSFWKSLTLQVP